LLETAATGNETVGWGKVSSIRGANTLFEGQQINGHTGKERTQRRRGIETREKTHTHTQRREKQRRYQRRRSRKIQAADPKRNQDCSETQRQRAITHCKQRL
jgi:hypothetical protein